MNNKSSNEMDRENEAIAKKLKQVAEQTHANSQFAAKLEQQLRSAHHPPSGLFAVWGQISPTLRWVALMVLLALVLSWSIKNLVPAPQPAANLTPTIIIPSTETATPEPINLTATPVKQEGGYDFRGAKLYLGGPLPETPDVAHIYLLKKDQPATQEQARALADRFGIQGGEVYGAPDYIFSTTDFAFSDGKQLLQVYSDRFFTYTADMAKSRIHPYGFKPSDREEATIQEFLKARGFDFSFKLSEGYFPGEYIVKPLSPDSIPMQYESFTQPVMRVALDENGEVLSVDAVLMEYNTTPLGEYGIISAQAAFQILLNDNVMAGKMEFFNAVDRMPQEWYRSYPDNQPVTFYGYLSFYPALEAGKSALVLINSVAVTGNVGGLEGLENNTFIKATGQFIVENGIRTFNVEAWDRKIQETTVDGVLTRQGDQIVITSANGTGEQYPLVDPPTNVPLDTKVPDTQLEASGVLQDGKLDWTYIQYYDDLSGGGGGKCGNGIGFYKLNLDGQPIPFPPSPTPGAATETNVQSPLIGRYTIKEGDTLTAIAQTFGTTVDALMQLNNLTDSNIYVGQSLNVPIPEPVEQPIQDLRGYLSISIHNKSDGTSYREYNLEVTQEAGSAIYTMDGSILSELDSLNGLPILVTGTIDKTGKLIVDSYKIPYPGLHFQILKGTQKVEPLAGQNVVVFTTEDGISYVEYLATNNIPNTTSIIGIQGDLIEEEVLVIPDETFGGLPVAHTYQSALVQENGPAMEPQANQIQTINESDLPSSNYIQPNLVIDQVELVYYVSNPYYQVNNPDYSLRSPYIQPAWHFRGRYEDGGEFDVLIQALRQDFLSPEIAPGLAPG